MKILYCNPVFLDYRIPFFKELVKLFKGEFHVMYSPNRYRLMHREDLVERIQRELCENEHPLKHDYLFDTATMSFNRVDATHGQKIPFTFGILRAIRKLKPDVLITEGFFQWTPLVQVYGLLHRVPVFVGYERTPWTERNNSRLKTWLRQMQDKAIRGYLVNGSETRKYLESIGVRSDKIHVGGMSADSTGLRTAIASMTEEEKVAFKARFQRGKRGLVYLFSGRVEHLKGAPHLLHAWTEHIKAHPHDRLVLIGMGEAYEGMKHTYQSETSVFLEGRIDYSEVHKYYAVADVFVLPTLQDNWSLVIPEAMSCGLPVATSIYNGCHPELVHEGENGTVFDPLDNASIVKALDYFHHHDLKQLGMRSIDLEELFNTANCAKREHEAVKKCLNGGGKNGLIYLFSGQMIERKGIIPLLEAWMEHVKTHPDDSLVVVGGGELLDTCKEQFGNEPSIYLEGRVNYAGVHKYYAVADVFVLPTIEDNWSLVVPEAMSCGLPIATSIYNGCHVELVHEGENGIVFDTFQQESIVRALDFFHNHDLTAMGQKSIELEKEFDTTHCAERLYNALVNNK